MSVLGLATWVVNGKGCGTDMLLDSGGGVLPSSWEQRSLPQLLFHSVQVGALCFGIVLQKRMTK